MKTIRDDKVALICPWEGTEEARAEAKTAFTQVAGSPYMIKVTLVDYYDEHPHTGIAEILTANSVAKAIADEIVNEGWEKFPFSDLVNLLTAALNDPPCREDIEYNKLMGYESAEEISEVFLIQMQDGVLDEIEDEISIDPPVTIKTKIPEPV